MGGRRGRRLADSSGLKGGRSGESSANNERAHFLFILLHSEWTPLVDASSELDSLPFFGRAAGIKTASKKESQGEGEGKPRRRRVVVRITVAKVADGFIGSGAQDFEQSHQSNHGRPRVGLVHGLGTRCGSSQRSNIRSKSGPWSRELLRHDDTRGWRVRAMR